MTRSIIRLTDQACTSTHHGSGSGSGTAPGSGMAPGLGTAPGSGPVGISEGISLAGSVVLAEDMAEVGRIASAEDIAEGIGSFRLAIAQRPWCSFASLGSLTSSLSPQ